MLVLQRAKVLILDQNVRHFEALCEEWCAWEGGIRTPEVAIEEMSRGVTSSSNLSSS